MANIKYLLATLLLICYLVQVHTAPTAPTTPSPPCLFNSPRPHTLQIPQIPDTWTQDLSNPNNRPATVGDIQTAVHYLEEYYYYSVDLCDQYSMPFGTEGTQIFSFDPSQPLTLHALITAFEDLQTFVEYYFQKCMDSGALPDNSQNPGVMIGWITNFPSPTNSTSSQVPLASTH